MVWNARGEQIKLRRGNIPFLICYIEDANRQPKGQVSLSAGSGKVMYYRSMGLVFIQVIFKIKETIDGIWNEIPSLCLTLEQPKHASWHVLLLLPEIPFSHIFIFLPSQHKEISARSPPLRSLP